MFSAAQVMERFESGLISKSEAIELAKKARNNAGFDMMATDTPAGYERAAREHLSATAAIKSLSRMS